MKAIILDGSPAHDDTGPRVLASLTAHLQARGWDMEHVVLCEKKIGNCAGDFFCWIRTPGVCNINDDNRAIAEAVLDSDLMVYLTPVTFGGYSSVLKRMVDHQIQNISPFFTKIGGETHHHKRYEEYPDFLVAGWMEAPDDQSEAVFRYLVQRNALNWHAETCVSGVVLASQSDGEMLASAEEWLSDLENQQSSQRVELPTAGETDSRLAEIRRALLLVGSPRARKSTSNSLGEYLFERLGAHSVQTETIYLHNVLHAPERIWGVLEAVDSADLVNLAFPVYVDSLPALVIESLEMIAAHRRDRETRRQLFTAIANCGFPEAQHCAAALAICETFARQARFAWMGSLMLGGGGMVGGMPLDQGGGKTVRIRKSLELAAESLIQNLVIPKAAQDSLAEPVIPPWAYRLLGAYGWTRRARHFGAGKLLKRRPYLKKAE